MKRTLRLLLTVGLSLVCVSLFAQKFPNYPIPQQPDTLRILGIGNSFTDDGMMYLPELLEAAGIRNVVLGRLYIAGCSLGVAPMPEPASPGNRHGPMPAIRSTGISDDTRRTSN